MDSVSSSVISNRKPPRYNITIQISCHDCQGLIGVLAFLTELLMVVRYILDLFRRRTSNQLLLFLLTLLATLPYTLLDYTIGLMQLSKSKNDVYQVWAVVLVTLRYSIRAVRPSNIFSKQNPLQDMMSSLWTANLLGTRTTLLKIPLWLLWSLNSVRIILGFADAELTSTTHRRHLMLLTEYMRTEHKQTPLKDSNAQYMKGYNYLVRGEDKQKIKSDPPEYRVRLEVTKEKKFITTSKVWEGDGVLLGEPRESNKLKDLCLSFALFKLLRRRFYGLPTHEAKQPKTKEFVLKGLIQNCTYDRAFGIIEAELAFLNDFFYTRFAVMFARGFPFMRLVLSLSVIGVSFYLVLIFYHLSDSLAGDLSKTTHGVVVTWMLLIMLVLKEIWEMATYVLSDWTKVILISNYVQKPWWTKYCAIVAVVKCFCNHKLAERWHHNLWQYNILQSFRYPPRIYNIWIMIRVQLGHFLCRRIPGYKRTPHVKIPKEVKSAIIESLQCLCNRPEDLGKYLSAAANSLYPDFEQKIPLSEFATETQRILVWHIATCYCEIILANTSQGITTFSSLKSPFLLENLDNLKKGLESHYKAATALSQYSAHLLTLRSPLVPGRSLVATELFLSTAETAGKILGRCRSWKEVEQKLVEFLSDEQDDDDGNNKDGGSQKRVRKCLIFSSSREKRERRARSHSKKGKIILKAGVRIGKALVEEIEDTVTLWKFLEKFWAGYLLYLAASVSPDGHKGSLFRGGEFLTHIWALLSHAGVSASQDRPSMMNNFIDAEDD